MIPLKMRNNGCEKKDRLEIIWEYEPSEDVEDRLAKIFDFLLNDEKEGLGSSKEKIA